MRLIAFYLPQFHPIPENDAWWGRGFTEWTNVVRARPQYAGHYQPHLPADLGFYDLRVPEVRAAQAALAGAYGIAGFCYYHYWFHGRRLLERPFEAVLAEGEPGLPFCLCWANDPWTRRWNGRDGELLIAVDYSAEDDQRHIEALLPAFRDARYLRINGRPVFLVYRTDLLPAPGETARLWRRVAERHGIDLYLIRVETLSPPVDPATIGFDASVEFAPDWLNMGDPARRPFWQRAVRASGLVARGRSLHNIYRYETLRTAMLAKRMPSYTLFRGVTPGFDNTSRREEGATIIEGSSPALYGSWLESVTRWTADRYSGDEQLVFINAWNEWAEGNHLEPDVRWGHAYLEATRDALQSVRAVGQECIHA